MESYLRLEVLGEGTYGRVYKCQHRQSGDIVAVKMSLTKADDPLYRSIHRREIRMLKRCQHENVVKLLDVFRHRRHQYAVFEYVEGCIADEVEMMGALPKKKMREYTFQILRAVDFLHSNNIIHRDIKVDNILVSSSGVVKLCDFGFARALPKPGRPLSDRVATLWYKPPELLVGDVMYSTPLDVWAIGCTVMIMATGEVFLDGMSELSQLRLIVSKVGPLTPHQKVFYMNDCGFKKFVLPEVELPTNPGEKFGLCDNLLAELVDRCFQMDPDRRSSCSELLQLRYFTRDGFPEKFIPKIQARIQGNAEASTPSPDKTAVVASVDDQPGASASQTLRCNTFSVENPKTTPNTAPKVQEKCAVSSPSPIPPSENSHSVVMEAVDQNQNQNQNRNTLLIPVGKLSNDEGANDDAAVVESEPSPPKESQVQSMEEVSGLDECGYKIVNAILNTVAKNSLRGWSSLPSLPGLSCLEEAIHNSHKEELQSGPDSVGTQEEMAESTEEQFQHFCSIVVTSSTKLVEELITKARSNLLGINTDENMVSVSGQSDTETAESLAACSSSALAAQVMQSTLHELAQMSSCRDFDAAGSQVDRCVSLASTLSVPALLRMEAQNSQMSEVLRMRRQMAAAVTDTLSRSLSPHLRGRASAVPRSPVRDIEEAAVTSSASHTGDTVVMSSSRDCSTSQPDDQDAVDSTEQQVENPGEPLAASGNEEPLEEKKPKKKKKGIRKAFSRALKAMRRLFTCCTSRKEDREET